MLRLVLECAVRGKVRTRTAAAREERKDGGGENCKPIMLRNMTADGAESSDYASDDSGTPCAPEELQDDVSDMCVQGGTRTCRNKAERHGGPRGIRGMVCVCG